MEISLLVVQSADSIMKESQGTKVKDNACVYFTEEKNYACVKLKSIDFDTNLYAASTDLIGQQLNVTWENEFFEAEIIAIGKSFVNVNKLISNFEEEKLWLSPFVLYR